MITLDKIKNTVAAIEADVEKVNNGNKAARVRVRNAMQEVKVLAQDIREQVRNLA